MTVLDLVVRTEISRALGWTLLHSLWEGIVIAVILGALLVLVRSARARYLAGCGSLLAMLISFAATLIHFLPNEGGRASTAVRATLPPWVPLPDMNRFTSGLPDPGGLISWLGPLWIIGVCLFYARYAASWLSLFGVRRRGVCKPPDSWQRFFANLTAELQVSRPVTLLESMLADTPVVLGHFRPVVLVPLGFLTSLSPNQVELILLHELAHVKRADYLLNVCQRLMEGLFFYHPAVWWISQLIRTERENCCDDVVVDLRGNAHSYALALATLEQSRLKQRWPAGAPAVAATGGHLMKRVKRLLYPKGPSGAWAPMAATVFLMTAAAMALSAWHLSPSQTSDQADKPSNPWQKWVNEDVVYLISAEEKAAFERSKTDEEREQFIEQFWARRDPTPGTPANEFKEEHYRRMAFANRRWGGNLPGWKTDRGRTYIRYGPPDEIDSHPSGGSYNRPESEGGGSAMTYPFEDWRYRDFENAGSLSVEFVDLSSSGDFRMTLDPNTKYKP